MAETTAVRKGAAIRQRTLPRVKEARFAEAGATQAFGQVREILETRLGTSAPMTERVPTWGELYNAGLVALRDANGNPISIGNPTGPVLPIPPLPGEDRIPPAPTDLQAVAGLSQVILTWSAPPAGDYVAYAEIFRAETQNLSIAVKVGQSSAWVYADYANGGRTYWYWVRWVSNGGKVGPFSLPASATLPFNPDWLLEVLAGQVTESALTKHLQTRIDLIDGPITMPGSVAARVLAEATARGAAIETEQTLRRDGDSAVAQTVTTLAAVVAGNKNLAQAALEEEASTRADADSATALRITTLQSVVTGNNNTLGAAIQDEARTRADADTALSTRVTTLQSTVTTNNSTQTAALQIEAQTRANVDGGLLAQYTVKVDVNGRVAGFGLASTANNGVPLSEFTVIADRFAVVSPSNPGQTPKVPFVIGTVDGVTATVIANAFIPDAAISRAKIGLAAIDDARIASLSAAKVTFGEMSGDRIAANSLNANRITATTLAAAIANIGTAYVNTANIVDGAITTAKIGNAQIGTAQIAGLAVKTANIEDLQVSEFKLMNGAISSVKIKDAAIQRAHIADLAVTTAKIEDGQITHFKLGDGAIHSAKILNAAIQTLHVAGNAITVPASFYADGAGGTGSLVTVAAVSMEAEGSPVTVVFSGVLLETASEDATASLYLDIRVNGGAITPVLVSGKRGTPICFTRQVSPGFGTSTISITSNAAQLVTRRSMTVIGTKR